MIGLFAKLLDGVLAPEVTASAHRSGFLRNSLRAVFAELGGIEVSLFGFRPGATGTIYTVMLIHSDQRQETTRRDGVLHGVEYGVIAGRDILLL